MHMVYMPKFAKLLERIQDDPEDSYHNERVGRRSPINGTLGDITHGTLLLPGDWGGVDFCLKYFQRQLSYKSSFRSSLILRFHKFRVVLNSSYIIF